MIMKAPTFLKLPHGGTPWSAYFQSQLKLSKFQDIRTRFALTAFFRGFVPFTFSPFFEAHFTGTWTTIWWPQCQLSKPEELSTWTKYTPAKFTYKNTAEANYVHIWHYMLKERKPNWTSKGESRGFPDIWRSLKLVLQPTFRHIFYESNLLFGASNLCIHCFAVILQLHGSLGTSGFHSIRPCFSSILTCGYWCHQAMLPVNFNPVATDALVLKHQAIGIHNAD